MRVGKDIEVSNLSEVDAAYIAGLLDGEGYIAVVKHSRKDRPPVYEGCVRVEMTARGPVDFVADLCGVNVLERELRTGRTAYRCVLHINRAASLLKQVLPHLKVKQDQARLVLELAELRVEERKHRTKPVGERSYFHVRAGRMVTQKLYGHSDAYRAETRRLYEACSALNG